MSNNAANIQEQLQALRASYAAQLPDKLEKIDARWRSLSGSEWDPAGGDDFPTKPIQDQHLISSVAVRAERVRMLSALRVLNSLTGLLEHTMIKEQLAQELPRAQRTQSALSFAMIDIDKFKLVNDRYGHMMGDRVINSLARRPQQRLRKSNRIGRYGGKEFAMVLPN